MAFEKATVDAAASQTLPSINTIGTADLMDALAKGIADFNATPTHYVFLCIIYPILTFIFARAAAGYDVLPLVFPIIAGSTLLGPLAASGMYELSRRREQGLDVSWTNCFDVIRSPSALSIAALGLVQGAIYLVWLAVALGIYWFYFGGTVPESIMTFAAQILTTPAGWGLIIVGCGAGFIFSVVVLTISVVSFPLLLDRNVGPVLAVQTSVRSVLANPRTMAIWGIIVVVALIVGAVPLFVGLAVVMPVLGHATWHLYRKAVTF